jgi:hypothetical protein
MSLSACRFGQPGPCSQDKQSGGDSRALKDRDLHKRTARRLWGRRALSCRFAYVNVAYNGCINQYITAHDRFVEYSNRGSRGFTCGNAAYIRRTPVKASRLCLRVVKNTVSSAGMAYHRCGDAATAAEIPGTFVRLRPNFDAQTEKSREIIDAYRSLRDDAS